MDCQSTAIKGMIYKVIMWTMKVLIYFHLNKNLKNSKRKVSLKKLQKLKFKNQGPPNYKFTFVRIVSLQLALFNHNKVEQSNEASTLGSVLFYYSSNSTAGAVQVEANLQEQLIDYLQFWPWKCRSKSQSMTLAMIPFDGEYHNTYNLNEASLVQFSPGYQHLKYMTLKSKLFNRVQLLQSPKIK